MSFQTDFGYLDALAVSTQEEVREAIRLATEDLE
jgi:hypothetical protein